LSTKIQKIQKLGLEQTTIEKQKETTNGKKNHLKNEMSKQKYLLLDFSVSCSKMLKQQQLM